MRWRLVNGSMRVMVPARAAATHTAPSPNATAVGSPETLISGPFSPGVVESSHRVGVRKRDPHAAVPPCDSARLAELRVPLAEPRVVADVDHVPPSVREPGVSLRIGGRPCGRRPPRPERLRSSCPGVDPPDAGRVTDPDRPVGRQPPSSGPDSSRGSAPTATLDRGRGRPARPGVRALRRPTPTRRLPRRCQSGVAPRRTVLRTSSGVAHRRGSACARRHSIPIPIFR